MTDRYGRVIDYMRVSVTDRCNLRCVYCIPGKIRMADRREILSYEEILRICEAAVALGIVNFKVTGGEPLAREGCAEFIARLKALPGARQVTLTTNGLLLEEHLDALRATGIDGINISVNTLRDDEYRELTGFPGHMPNIAAHITRMITLCVDCGLRVKINTVLLAQTLGHIYEIAMLARDMPVDVRFIEKMPIGDRASVERVTVGAALERLREKWTDLRPVDESRGNGPARYYAADALTGRIGFIGALSQGFCERCNRVRLTSTGRLKLCLCYSEGCDLKALLEGGCGDETLRETMRGCIMNKPEAHCFIDHQNMTERKGMNQIGG